LKGSKSGNKQPDTSNLYDFNNEPSHNSNELPTQEPLNGGQEPMPLDNGNNAPQDAAMPENEVTKEIQSLTGTLAQKIRENANSIDAKMIKYIYNSFASAIDTSKLEQNDLDDIINKLKATPQSNNQEPNMQPQQDNQQVQEPQINELNEDDQIVNDGSYNVESLSDNEFVNELNKGVNLNLDNKFEKYLFLEGLYLFYQDFNNNQTMQDTLAKVGEIISNLDEQTKVNLSKATSTSSKDDLEPQSALIYDKLERMGVQEGAVINMVNEITQYIKNKTI
jgi:hypothetical protein